MDFAISPSQTEGDTGGWDVLCLCVERGAERPLRLASFGYRSHAEAFLRDLLPSRDDAPHG